MVGGASGSWIYGGIKHLKSKVKWAENCRKDSNLHPRGKTPVLCQLSYGNKSGLPKSVSFGSNPLEAVLVEPGVPVSLFSTALDT